MKFIESSGWSIFRKITLAMVLGLIAILACAAFALYCIAMINDTFGSNKVTGGVAQSLTIIGVSALIICVCVRGMIKLLD